MLLHASTSYATRTVCKADRVVFFQIIDETCKEKKCKTKERLPTRKLNTTTVARNIISGVKCREEL